MARGHTLRNILRETNSDSPDTVNTLLIHVEEPQSLSEFTEDAGSGLVQAPTHPNVRKIGVAVGVGQML